MAIEAERYGGSANCDQGSHASDEAFSGSLPIGDLPKASLLAAKGQRLVTTICLRRRSWPLRPDNVA